MNPQMIVAVVKLPSHDGIIKVFGLNTVDRNQWLSGNVFTTLLFFWQHVIRNGVGLIHDRLWENMRNVMGIDNGENINPRLILVANNLSHHPCHDLR